MNLGVSAVCFIVAVVLFILAAFPPVPYNSSLVAAGLAFLTAGHLAGG